MNASRFLHRLHREFDDFPRSPHPRDRRFSTVMRALPGLASENKLMMLNVAGSLLPATEAYVEVGAWFGLSIIAASVNNARSPFFAIDNFSEFGGSGALLERNLARFGVNDRVTVIEADCFGLFRTPRPFGNRRVGVFFYDGNHSYDAQRRALQLIRRHLADEALIIIDDTSYERVRDATAHYARFQPDFRLLFDIRTHADRDPVWWNGIQAFAFRRHRGRQGAKLSSALHRRVMGEFR